MKTSAYVEKDREAKSIVSGDKRRCIKNKATNAENAAKLDQMGTLYIKLLNSCVMIVQIHLQVSVVRINIF